MLIVTKTFLMKMIMGFQTIKEKTKFLVNLTSPTTIPIILTVKKVKKMSIALKILVRISNNNKKELKLSNKSYN